MAPRDLSAGMSGVDVQAIQQALNLQPNLPGPPLDETGVFDPATVGRVVAYQKLKKLPQTGVVDAATRLALYPYGVATITIFGSRLTLPDLAAPSISSRIPNFSTYQLTPPTWAAPRLGTSWEPLPKHRWGLRDDALADWRDRVGWSDPTRLSLDWMRFSLSLQEELAEDPSKPCLNQVRLPNANVELPVQDSFNIKPFEPASVVRGGPFSVLGFTYNHTEIVPGGQSTFPYGGNRPGFSFSNRQDAVTLTMQMVYQRGPDDGHNQTLTGGVQVGAPITGDFPNGGPWTFNPFIQFTDVDLLGNFGFVHLWQPYAQLGLQFQGPGDPHPTINGGLFPINLGFDIGKRLTLQATGGVPFAYDFQTRTASWGLQGGFGIAIKLGDVSPVVRWGQQ